MKTVQRLRKDHILFLFIDLQTKLLEKIPQSKELVESCRVLLEAAQTMGCSVMATSQYRSGLGEVVPEIANRTEGPIVDKTCFSCVADRRIHDLIQNTGRDTIVVSGVETHICVLQTGLDLLLEGYHVAVVTDAVGARKAEDHLWGLKRLETAGALMVTGEMVIYELLGRSDTDTFKKVLPLIKAASAQ